MEYLLETKHLLIRKTTVEDCGYFSDWEKRPEVSAFFSIDEDRDYAEVVREFIVRETDDSKRQFTIVLRETEQPVGRIYLSRIDKRSDSCDITRIYIADASLRGKGYGEEALRALLDHCFLNLHTERVTLDHFTGNHVAAALYAKIGFSYEGIARNAAKKDGRYYDLHLMSMLRSEFFERVHKEQ